MTMLMAELLVAGLIVVVVALLTRRAWEAHRRGKLRGSITETQARENAAPLTTAIMASGRREYTGL
jgi:hypothetical protein